MNPVPFERDWSLAVVSKPTLYSRKPKVVRLDPPSEVHGYLSGAQDRDNNQPTLRGLI